MANQLSPSQKGGFAPAITLMLMAPLLTEILPGATRFSSIFVLPIEMCVWGTCALFVREALRRRKLGWVSMVLLGLAVAIAEECLIQQTSLAPLVIKLKGQTYARAFGVNYIYFLWALIYEPVFVVILPITVVEMIFPSRGEMPWVSKAGWFVLTPLLVIGSLLAWFSWTQIARVKVFHLPAYHAPAMAILLSVAAIALLIVAAFRIKPTGGRSLKPLSPRLLGLMGAIWAVLLYGVVLLGFGIDPAFPAWLAIAGALFFLVILPLVFLPKFVRDRGWELRHRYGLTCGTIIGSMAAGQLGFIGTTGPDLYFKIISNVVALILLLLLNSRQKKQTIIS